MDTLTWFLNIITQVFQKLFVEFEFFGTTLFEFSLAVLFFTLFIKLFLYVPNIGQTLIYGARWGSRRTGRTGSKSNSKNP